MLNITTVSLYMILASITGNVESVQNVQIPTNTQPQLVEEKSNQKQLADKTVSTEAYVRSYFSDLPIMIEVARCESHFRQIDRNGKVLRGKENRFDVGVMQINEIYHADTAKKLGFDIYTVEGNTAFARYLYEKNGIKDWKPSWDCSTKVNQLAMRTDSGVSRE